MYVVFFSTSDVFEAEEMLNENNIICKIVPTPVTDKAYCGVCIFTEVEKQKVEEILEFEYEIVMEV